MTQASHTKAERAAALLWAECSGAMINSYSGNLRDVHVDVLGAQECYETVTRANSYYYSRDTRHFFRCRVHRAYTVGPNGWAERPAVVIAAETNRNPFAEGGEKLEHRIVAHVFTRGTLDGVPVSGVQTWRMYELGGGYPEALGDWGEDMTPREAKNGAREIAWRLAVHLGFAFDTTPTGIPTAFVVEHLGGVS